MLYKLIFPDNIVSRIRSFTGMSINRALPL